MVEMLLMHFTILLMTQNWSIQHIKDLGITSYVKLNFSLHISEKVNAAYAILGIIKRNFGY